MTGSLDTRSLIWGMSVKVAFWLYLLILLAGTAACGGGHAGTPTELSATETPERPTATPTEQPHTETPQTPISEIPLDHPAAPLALLPVDASSFTFVDIESVGQRPAFQEDVEFQLSHFVSGDEIPFAEELLRSIGASSLALSSLDDRFEWACVLRGDFAQVQSALRQAAESGVGLSVSIIETHLQVAIFALVRERASSESEVYLTVLDEQTLAVSPDLDAMREIINRLQDSLSLPEPLAMMLQDWGLPKLPSSLQSRNRYRRYPVESHRSCKTLRCARHSGRRCGHYAAFPVAVRRRGTGLSSSSLAGGAGRTALSECRLWKRCTG